MPTILRNNKVLWTLQILLAALYLFAGGLKLVAAPDQLRPTPADPIPSANMMVFLRAIGGFEVLGALGLILPGLTGIKRHLTFVAAGCLAFIMLGAVVVCVRADGRDGRDHPVCGRTPRPGRDGRPAGMGKV